MKKIFDTLTTPYSDKMDRELPHNEYPRTSMVRDSFFCLNGEWQFSVFLGEECENTKITVPFPPESTLSGYGKAIPEGAVMKYERRFTLPEGFVRSRVILHFGAVDTLAEVFINGSSVIKHKGGYLPFSLDITDFISVDCENRISVTVRDDLDKKYPYGKQKRNRGGMWYTPVSGIWQTVWLESVPENYIERLKITGDMKGATIRVFGAKGIKKRLVLDGASYEFSEDEIRIEPEKINLWSPENPYIYDFDLYAGEDKVSSYFALREIGSSTFDGIPRLTLNGLPYLFNGLLDQGYFPDGIFLPATSEGYKEDILRTKSLGFNTLRKHIKIEPEIFYTLCDRLGIVVFQDMVNNSSYSFFFDTVLPTIGVKRLPDCHKHPSRESRRIFTEHSLSTLEHLHNFPSVLYYTVFNEGWGQFSADKMYKIIKDADPTRIVDATSGWFTRHESDVDSRHVYFKRVKLRGTPKRPLVISEFGGYSHRVSGHLFGSANYGYKQFENKDEFENAFLTLYGEEILPLIKRGVSALIYTQLSDVEDETNGLITYDRRVIKINEKRARSVMQRLSAQIENGEEN